MSKMFDCPHCGVTTAIPEGMYLDSDDCEVCGRNYWEMPLIEEEEEMNHTPEDSLIYLDHEVAALLEAAYEEIHGVSTEHISETKELPEHIQEVVAMLDTARDLIRSEAYVHGLAQRGKYSNGIPVREHYQKPGSEPQADGTAKLVMHDYVTTLYPDGFRGHPAFRKENK